MKSRNPATTTCAVTTMAVAALLLAACGVVGQATRSGSGAKHQVHLSESRPGRAASKARAYAKGLLASLRLPAGAERTGLSRGSPLLLKPGLPARQGNVARVGAFYRINAPASSVQRFLMQHTPAGMKHAESGTAGRNGAIRARYINYLPRTLPRELFDAELATAIVSVESRKTLLHIEAQVTWYPPRSSAEYIVSREYRAVTISAPAPHGGGDRSVRRTFTSAILLTRLSALVNDLNARPAFTGSCPMIPVAPYSISFIPRAASGARVVVTPSGCFSDSVRIAGASQPLLYDPRNTVIAEMNRLLSSHAK